MEVTIDICQEPDGYIHISIARWDDTGILEKVKYHWLVTNSSYKRCQRFQEKLMKEGKEKNETS